MADLAKKSFLDLAGLTKFWEKAKAYIDTADLQASEDLTGVINGLSYSYDTDTKTINLKNGEKLIGTVNCTDFIKDSFVKSGSVVEVGGKQVLRLVLHTVERPGETPTTENVDIDVDKLFSQLAADIKMANGETVEKALTDVIAESAQNKTNIESLTDRVDSIEGSSEDYKAADTALKTEITAAYEAADLAVYDSIEAIATTEIEALFD